MGSTAMRSPLHTDGLAGANLDLDLLYLIPVHLQIKALFEALLGVRSLSSPYSAQFR